MSNYILSANAMKSLRQIKAHSLKKFGAQQTKIYIKSLHERMKYLAKNPKHGRLRDNIKLGYHSYPEGSHVIYYIIINKGIGVIDILHQSMDVESHI